MLIQLPRSTGKVREVIGRIPRGFGVEETTHRLIGESGAQVILVDGEQFFMVRSQGGVERLAELLHDSADAMFVLGGFAKGMQPQRHGGARQLVQMIVQLLQESGEVLLGLLRRPAQIFMQVRVDGGFTDTRADLLTHQSGIQLLIFMNQMVQVT